jgi:hypothetical protein
MLKEVVLYHHDPQIFRQNDTIVGIVSFANQLTHVFLEKNKGDVDPFINSWNLTEKQVDYILQESIPAIEEYYSIL